MIYLASPYSHPDQAVRQQRFEQVCRAAAVLLRQGEIVFSPVVHSHPIAACGLPTDWRFWQRFDRQLLERCDELVVLMLPGWQWSAGIQAELRIAGQCSKPVRYLVPEVAVLTCKAEEKCQTTLDAL
jgi:hypothetical protein